MLQTNPFSILAETVAPIAMQGFIIAMIILIVAGTVVQMIHHKILHIFLIMQKKRNYQQLKNWE